MLPRHYADYFSPMAPPARYAAVTQITMPLLLADALLLPVLLISASLPLRAMMLQIRCFSLPHIVATVTRYDAAMPSLRADALRAQSAILSQYRLSYQVAAAVSFARYFMLLLMLSLMPPCLRYHHTPLWLPRRCRCRFAVIAAASCQRCC